jgi:hypothetical protein
LAPAQFRERALTAGLSDVVFIARSMGFIQPAGNTPWPVAAQSVRGASCTIHHRIHQEDATSLARSRLRAQAPHRTSEARMCGVASHEPVARALMDVTASIAARKVINYAYVEGHRGDADTCVTAAFPVESRTS